MKKNFGLWVGIIIGVLLLIGVLFFFLKSETQESDALKFKREYEMLNDTIRESDGAKYNNVVIAENNPIQYISATEAVQKLKSESGIFYFGANWCPWCRNAIEVLFEAAKEENLDTIYYVDMDTVRNIWEIKEKQLVKTKVEGDGYYDLLNALDSVLKGNYILTDADGTKYDTNEKRIGMPLIISVRDGDILESHTGTVKLNENQTKYSKLEKNQIVELKNVYQSMIQKTK